MQRALSLFRSPIGKKVLLALSGAVIFGYLFVHMFGLVQIFRGAEVVNEYGRVLHENPALLWLERIILLIAIPVHVFTAVALMKLQATARPARYAQRTWTHGSYASRTMRWSGPFLAIFILFHLAHFTWGWQVTPAPFVAGDVYSNMVKSFQIPWVALFYVVATLLVGLHLSHGAWSMFQSLGMDHPKYGPAIKKGGRALTILITAGFLSMPVAIVLRLFGGEG